jgi:hypothetical protein
MNAIKAAATPMLIPAIAPGERSLVSRAAEIGFALVWEEGELDVDEGKTVVVLCMREVGVIIANVSEGEVTVSILEVADEDTTADICDVVALTVLNTVGTEGEDDTEAGDAEDETLVVEGEDDADEIKVPLDIADAAGEDDEGDAEEDTWLASARIPKLSKCKGGEATSMGVAYAPVETNSSRAKPNENVLLCTMASKREL